MKKILIISLTILTLSIKNVYAIGDAYILIPHLQGILYATTASGAAITSSIAAQDVLQKLELGSIENKVAELSMVNKSILKQVSILNQTIKTEQELKRAAKLNDKKLNEEKKLRKQTSAISQSAFGCNTIISSGENRNAAINRGFYQTAIEQKVTNMSNKRVFKKSSNSYDALTLSWANEIINGGNKYPPSGSLIVSGYVASQLDQLKGKVDSKGKFLAFGSPQKEIKFIESISSLIAPTPEIDTKNLRNKLTNPAIARLRLSQEKYIGLKQTYVEYFTDRASKLKQNNNASALVDAMVKYLKNVPIYKFTTRITKEEYDKILKMDNNGLRNYIQKMSYYQVMELEKILLTQNPYFYNQINGKTNTIALLRTIIDQNNFSIKMKYESLQIQRREELQNNMKELIRFDDIYKKFYVNNGLN